MMYRTHRSPPGTGMQGIPQTPVIFTEVTELLGKGLKKVVTEVTKPFG